MKPSTLRKLSEVRFQLLLRIKHPTIDAGEITRALNLEPEHAVTAGQAFSASGKQRLHSESYWVATLPTRSLQEAIDSWRSMSTTAQLPALPQLSKEARQGLGFTQGVGFIDLQILGWLNKLDPHVAFFKIINDAQGSVTLVLQRPNRDAPVTITPYLARRLAELGIRFEID